MFTTATWQVAVAELNVTAKQGSLRSAGRLGITINEYERLTAELCLKPVPQEEAVCTQVNVDQVRAPFALWLKGLKGLKGGGGAPNPRSACSHPSTEKEKKKNGPTKLVAQHLLVATRISAQQKVGPSLRLL